MRANGVRSSPRAIDPLYADKTTQKDTQFTKSILAYARFQLPSAVANKEATDEMERWASARYGR